MISTSNQGYCYFLIWAEYQQKYKKIALATYLFNPVQKLSDLKDYK